MTMFETETPALVFPLRGYPFIGRVSADGGAVLAVRNSRTIRVLGDDPSNLYYGPSENTEMAEPIPLVFVPICQIEMAFPVKENPAWQI